MYEVSLYGYDRIHNAAAGNSVALKLTAGDRIYVLIDGSTYVFNEFKQVFCTFSGYLVAPFLEGHTIIG